MVSIRTDDSWLYQNHGLTGSAQIFEWSAYLAFRPDPAYRQDHG